ncbi:MAG: ABC-2 family transporter protein [Patescibacteria group bacterium]
MTNELRKYWGYFMLEFKRTSFYWPGLLFRISLITLRLVLPFSVFEILRRTGKISDFDATFALWAVLIGQILHNCDIRLSKRIKQEVRSGDIIIRLMDPTNYVFAKVAGSLGFFLPSFIVYSLIFIPIVYLILPIKFNLIILLTFTLIAALISNLIGLLVGMSSFFIEENDGIELVVGKLMFIFGNQIIPIILMPIWVQNIARLTPFYMALAAPIDVASGKYSSLIAFGQGIIYIALLLWFAFWMLNKIKRKLVLNG